MSGQKKYIAVDLGAESGRVMLGTVSADELTLQEIYRFTNGPIEQNSSLRWDFQRMFSEIKTGIAKAASQAGGSIAGLGVDSWGVDFGLIDEKGKLIENPYHYRDSRTNEIMEKAFEIMPKREIYEHTGLQFIQFNSVYQLLAMRLTNSDVLAKAKKLIFIADLVSYFLCGQAFAEYTLASTSQMMNMRTGQWSKEIFEKLSLPIDIMPEVVQPGTVVGKLTKEIAKECGCGQITVIAVASHDTGCAVASVPAEQDINWAYLSSGTWSLTGLEIPKAIINDQTFDYSLTNEGGVENTIRLLKNIMGLWLVQECKRQWQSEGDDLSYVQLTALAEKAKPFSVHIDVDDICFLPPGDMPSRINDYLTRTDQQRIEDKGQMVRAILQNLALKYRQVMEQIEDASATKIDCLHIVGGGSQSKLLNQFTANALGKMVITGPVEATAIGNILMQAKATEQIKILAQLRQIVRNSFELTEFQPKDAWPLGEFR